MPTADVCRLFNYNGAMRTVLPQKFYDRSTLKVARELLGKFLVRKIGRKQIVGMITEVEAYVGPKDRASHASRGVTKRTKVMFGKPGHWYVYLIYGMHYCLNIVTEKEEYPAAILIRSVAIVPRYSNILENIGISYITGPGRVCKYFKIDKRFNAKPANKPPHHIMCKRSRVQGTAHDWCGGKKTGLWIEDRGVRASRIKRGKRIGVDYAGKWKDKLWRFYLLASSKRVSP